MFVLIVVRDTVVIAAARVHPDKLEEAIRWKLESKYANRVITGSGLVIKLHDILYIGDGKVYPGEGNTAVTVQFRLVVFRPFEGELLVGRVKSSTVEGIVVSMNFFEHVFIPRDGLKDQCAYAPEHGLWKWIFEDESGETHPLWIENGVKIRFKVLRVDFVHPEPTKPSHTEEVVPKKTPMTVFGTIEESGLGPMHWWDEAQEEQQEEEQEPDATEVAP